MEQDRYQVSHSLYLMGMINLLLSLSFLFFSLYIIPYFLFGWRYDVPAFLFEWSEWLKLNYAMNEQSAGWSMVLFFLIPGLIFCFGACFSSVRIDHVVCGMVQPKKVSKKIHISQGLLESTFFFCRVMLILILVYAAILAFQWVISGNMSPF